MGPEAASDALAEPLSEIRAFVAEREYGAAARVMDESVRARVRETVVEYEAALNEPTRPELLGLVDELVGRLETLAETTG